MVRNYELMVITDPEHDEESVERFIDRFAALISEQGGRVTDVDRWGKRRLAYEIKDRNEGIYLIIKFQGDTKVTGELARVLKLSDDVLRHTIVRLGDDEGR